MKRIDHPIMTRVSQQARKNSRLGQEASIRWWQLALIGISSVIGAGFFLGSSLSIHAAGASVLIGYLISGITALTVFSSLAEMTVNDPERGSFRTYAKKAYGSGFAFVFGWIYWFAGLLIVSSEITALATFTRFWFPHVPLWLLCILFAAVGTGIVLSGVKNFGTIESFFAIIKTSALIAFLLFALIIFLKGSNLPPRLHSPFQSGLFPNGFFGLWQSLIVTLLSFGGIEIVGLTADRCRTDKEVLQAGFSMIGVLLAIYLSSLAAILALAKFPQIDPNQSPFVTALAIVRVPYIDSMFNLIILTAAFSTMLGALYSMTTILGALADDDAAPRFLKNHKSQQKRCLAVTFLLLIVLISSSYFLPKTVYEYLATAAGTMLLLNWLNILLSNLKNRKNYHGLHWRLKFQPFFACFGILIILFSICGALFNDHQRVSVLLSVSMLSALSFIYLLRKKAHGNKEQI
ncbi:amino acid permease [Sporolactobacillus spathodeae]|uniref:L-asparagine transporter-like permease n=1 Tax=Sporolactobacillus spathodeae TaxID=1465502 RepID=A0ABS2QAL7_9BACL|nr:L-asparagine transporter-like permease [Sporolactobacillus spathodeae]